MEESVDTLFSAMALQKRFPPTKRKLKTARIDGDIAKSRDLTSAIVMICSAIILLFSSIFWQLLLDVYQSVFASINRVSNDSAARTFLLASWKGFQCCFLILVPSSIVAFLVESSQVGIVFSAKGISFKLSRLNPVDGLRRMFGIQSENGHVKFSDKLFEIIKAAAYIGIGLLAILLLWLFCLEELVWLSISVDLFDGVLASSFIVKMVAAGVLGGVLLFAVLDYSLERKKQVRRLMMDIEELKRDIKDSDGDPHTKSRRREIHQSFLIQGLVERVRRAKVLLIGKL